MVTWLKLAVIFTLTESVPQVKFCKTETLCIVMVFQQDTLKIFEFEAILLPEIM